MALRGYLIGEVAQDYTDGMLTRRDALRRLTLLGLTVTGAGALLTACGGDDGPAPAATNSAAATTPPATATPGSAAARGSLIRFAGPAGELQGAFAPADAPRGAVLVVHENRGLTPHFYDMPGRLSEAGYSALCVDLLSHEGGTAALPEPGSAPGILAAARPDRLLGDLRAGLAELQRREPGSELGAVGFCFGGGMIWNLLADGETRLAAAAPFYGPAPDAPDFSRARAAVLAVYGEKDSRVNASRPAAEAALQRAGRPYQVRTFPGADHAFFNDTGPRYDPKAAREAYQLLLDWFGRYVAT